MRTQYQYSGSAQNQTQNSQHKIMHTLADLKSGRLSGATHIKLSEQLQHFPEELFALADTLEILDLSNNQLSSLPDEFACFQRLRILFLSNNQFEHLPEILTACTNLSMIGFKSNRIREVTTLPPHTHWLILTDNAISHLPEDIGRYYALQKLMLTGNKLRQLPNSMSQCINLELIRLAANQLETIPNWLVQLPKLAWLAFSGNPCSTLPLDTTDRLPQIKYSQLTLKHTLGTGASGVIYQADWHQAHCTQEVAVKVFKGEITSDGYPSCELEATIAAGSHPNLVKLLGKINSDAQNTQQGLLLELIPQGYKNLAGPPSFASCTRDIYPAQRIFSDTRNILLQLAKTAQHIHQQGVMHGDLYGHNILINSKSQCLLGDFGAATRYQHESELAHHLERLETLAFAHLTGELLHRTPFADTALWQIHHACSNPIVEQRLGFAEIVERLQN